MFTNPSMQFDELLRDVGIRERAGSNPRVSDVVYDSRKVTPGALFVAMQGGTTDGNRYVENALEQHAVAVVTDSEATWQTLRADRPELAIAQVDHGRRALAGISANFFSHPECRLHLCGVTGTNGKTTTTYLIEAMLRSAGRISILVGTIEYHVAQEIRPSPHTTPESRDLFQLFAEGLAAGATEAVMEVSSHALDQGRVWGLHWDTAVFTNLTQDHLDYHGTMEAYFEAKAKMFTGEGAAPAACRRDPCCGRVWTAPNPAGTCSGMRGVGIRAGSWRFLRDEGSIGSEWNALSDGDAEG